MSALSIGFGAPLVLGALVLLVGIWWLFRLIPPRPREVAFPPTRLLERIAEREKTPEKSPWWLTALRILMAALVILALAQPIWRPLLSAATGAGPLVLVIDNGWAAAPDFAVRREAALAQLSRAEEAGRPVALIATADGTAQRLEPGTVGEVRQRLEALDARPFAADRSALVTPLRKLFADTPPGEIVWIADPVDYGDSNAFSAFLREVAGGAAITVVRADGPAPIGIVSTDNGAEALTATLARAESGVPREGRVRAIDPRGRVMGEATFAFPQFERRATATFPMPLELRNQVARVEIEGMETAAAVQLLDERWRRRAVGLLSGAGADLDQPLLSPLHYISRALGPFADVREPRSPDVVRGVPELVRENVSVIVSADVGTFGAEPERLIREWMQKGGVLVRFAGPRLAQATDDRLLPVRVRKGGRLLGGALSWEQPQGLGTFAPTGPLAGLPVPTDVSVTRQVLAEPDADLSAKTWASLADGTPLVTAERIGQGWLVLVHVTADTTWSNLPLSGAFVEMLRRIVSVSTRIGPTQTPADGRQEVVLLPPWRLLDATGRFVPPGAEAKPLADTATSERPGAAHPPGLYGTDQSFFAFNLLRAGDRIVPIDPSPLAGVARFETLAADRPLDLKPWLLSAAFVLLLVDALAVLFLAGRLVPRRVAAAIGALGLAGLLALAAVDPSHAADRKPTDAFDVPASLTTSLAYVLTGDSETDEASRRGLEGLSRILADRTALEPGTPIGVDIARDELAFFPLIYWAVTPAQPVPPPEVMARIEAFMKNGGTVLFDTRDQATNFGGTTPATDRLRRILAAVDVPTLEPVPSDHVLTKAFYLLSDFPGRYTGGPLWVEQIPASAPNAERPVRAGDGVTPIMITSNDLAGAWAVGADGDWLYPTVPPDPRQREMAFRVGVNIVIYALTGNYKADQVHVPALLERLGQ